MPVTWEELSCDQKKIIMDNDGVALILAGPGSGKTEILAHKIAYLIKNQAVSENEILSITFSRKAMNEMQDRMSKFEGFQDKKFNISTLHAIALRLLYSNGLKRKVLVSTDESFYIMKDAVLDVLHKSDSGSVWYWLNFINKLKIDGKNYWDLSGEPRNIYQRYEELLLYNDVLDLEGIILRGYNLLREKGTQKNHNFILVDEFQDLNKTEFEFIKKIAEEAHHLFVVGDDDQSIYGWRGADPSIITNFSTIFPGSKINSLNYSYRVPNNILKGALQIVSKVQPRISKTFESVVMTEDKIGIVLARDKTTETKWLCDSINKYLSEGCVPNKIAILSKELALLEEIKQELEDSGIKYLFFGEKDILFEDTMRFFFSVLRVLNDPHDNLAVRYCLETSSDFNIGSVKINTLRETAEKKNLSFWGTMINAEKIEETKKWNTDYKMFASFILDLFGAMNGRSFLRQLDIILDELGITTEYRDIIMDLRERSKAENLPKFVEYYLDRKANSAERQRVVDETSDAIRLMTLHSSKGLGFEVVYFVGLNEGILPNPEQDIGEQRRLCYVGMTRCEKKLFMCHCEEITGKSAHGHKKYNPSQFLQELSKEYYDRIDLIK
ncbi:MAG: ATP-dependent helicase [Candidatus Heimdallarchaeaceae archaeon]